MGTIVIAIGGNAILNPEKGNPQEQQKLIDNTTGEIVEDPSRKVMMSSLRTAMGPRSGTSWRCRKSAVHPQPLDVCGAQTQGLIGYLLQQSIGNRLKEKGMK